MIILYYDILLFVGKLGDIINLFIDDHALFKIIFKDFSNSLKLMVI